MIPDNFFKGDTMTTNWQEEFEFAHGQAQALVNRLRDMEKDRDAQKEGRELAEAEVLKLHNIIKNMATQDLKEAAELADYIDHIDTQESVRPR